MVALEKTELGFCGGWCSTRPQPLHHSLAPSSISAPFPVPQSMAGTEDLGLGSVLKEPIIYGETGLKIILVYYAKS